jgi:lipid-binding SYLF domain-containing protein
MPRPSRNDAPHLLVVVCFVLSLWPTTGGVADLEELEEIIDEARLTFARFTGHPDMAWFRERARKARAVFIAPQVTRASYLFGASWGTGVLLVRDSSTGRWSQPAFYQVTGLSFGLQIGALHSEVVALATDDRAADEMVDGAFTLGIRGAFGAGRYGGGLSGSLETTSGAGFVTLESPTGLFVGIATGATLVLVRDGANELYYGRPVELDELKGSRIRQWYSDRLVKTLTDLAASPEAPP